MISIVIQIHTQTNEWTVYSMCLSKTYQSFFFHLMLGKVYTYFCMKLLLWACSSKSLWFCLLVIVILLVLRRRYQKESVALGKMSGEIHEQLVTYDEEGGGEMDTNGYDVSILTSARHDASLLPGPGLYAMVNKPQACKGDMAAMIEVKKDEADHDRDGYPYDTLHIYGYEGPGSLAGSLSSLGSSSSGDSLDYDFLNEWGPRFRTLAELYGVDCYPGDYPY